MSPSPLSTLLEAFPARPLETMVAATLLDRVDAKFLVPAAFLPQLLTAAQGEYDVLTVRGARSQRYETTYFDTPTLAFYHAHHAGRPNRHKVRARHYVATGARMLEVKTRSASGRTLKQRSAWPASDAATPIDVRALPSATQAVIEDAPLLPVLTTSFDRATLLRRSGSERVTIDTDLRVADGAQEVALRGMILVEVKQELRGPSPVLDALRRAGLRPKPISKYCLGVALLRPDVKHNRFKPLLSTITRLRDSVPLPLAG